MMRPERRFPFLIGLAAASLLLGLGLAQDAGGDASGDASEDPDLERRVITIDSSGGTQSGNLRFGPIVYEHPDPLGIVATVSNLTIRGPRAELSAPEDTLLAQAKGERTAAFDGGVQVTRGRLEADGPELVYREATGLGVLDGGVDVVIAADDEEGDPTEIEASLIEFDVDTDRSVSRGDVILVNGTQRAEADALTYAETIDLGRLECEGLCTVIRGADDGTVMTITAQEIRVLTQDERLWARGQVTIVDGDITTRGSEAVYDDNEQIAEITGSPARSENEASGVTLESDRILQDIEFDYVEAIDASAASDVDLTAFLFEEEQGAGEPAAP